MSITAATKVFSITGDPVSHSLSPLMHNGWIADHGLDAAVRDDARRMELELFPPDELAPTNQQQLHWPKFGQHFETSGKAGEAPDLPEVAELLKLNNAWRNAKSQDERAKIWHRMLAIHSEQIYSIGVVNGVSQPVVVRNTLRNVPEKGMYNWDPGAFFGIYRPETFWISK